MYTCCILAKKKSCYYSLLYLCCKKLFVLQIIQSRKCVLQKLLRPFSRAEGGLEMLAEEIWSTNDWIRRLKRSKRLESSLEDGLKRVATKAINFNIYFYRGSFKIWLNLKKWSSLLIWCFMVAGDYLDDVVIWLRRINVPKF